jgi:glycosyltransferase involved in cell wall biosynthesis
MIPFFSIITVTKNTEEKIDKTIQSVLSQSYKNFEYIIVDGHSKDDTFNKIKKYKNVKIKIFSRRDKNFYDGLNFAIKKTKGSYISILNSGDLYFSVSILKKMSAYILKYKNFDLYFSNLFFMDKKRIKRIWTYKNFLYNLTDAFKIAHPTIFFSRQVAHKFKYNIKYSISADLDLILKLIKKKISYKHLNFFSVIMETGGMSSFRGNFFKKLEEDLKIHKKYFKFYIFNFIFQKLLKTKTIYITNKKTFKSKK